MNFTFETLIQMYDYHVRMANYYNDIWYEVGDENYVLCMQHLKCLKAYRKEIENRI